MHRKHGIEHEQCKQNKASIRTARRRPCRQHDRLSQQQLSLLLSLVVTGLRCGKPAVEPSVSTRIVGGEEAIEHSWPWQCHIHIAVEDSSFECGGSVIGDRWILTAAHCL